ncbi:MAG: hypothetical protein ACM3NW_00645, partial [Syntrophomonadaceae bacterium]
AKQTDEPDKAHLNELSREMYRQEAVKLLASISKLMPEGEAPLTAPDMKFHRSIGEFAGGTYSVTGEKLTPEEYERHIAEVLPNESEKTFVRDLMREPGWIAPRTDVTVS